MNQVSLNPLFSWLTVVTVQLNKVIQDKLEFTRHCQDIHVENLVCILWCDLDTITGEILRQGKELPGTLCLKVQKRKPIFSQ